MIDEKHLLKLMDKAYKGGGYILVNGARGIELLCEDAWRFGIDNDKVSAKIKAKLVEHMDFLPTAEGAWKIYPDGAQSMDRGTALAEAGAWVPQRKLEMQRTDLSYSGMVIYQNEKTGVCAAIPSTWLLTAGEVNVMVDTEHGLCYKEEAGESACGRCVTKRTETATEVGLRIAVVLKALETIRIVGAKTKAEIADQVDLLQGEGEEDEEA